MPPPRQLPWTTINAPIPAGGGWSPKLRVVTPFVEPFGEPAVRWERRWMFPLTPIVATGCPPVNFLWSSSANGTFKWSSSINADFIWDSSLNAFIKYGC